MINTFLLNGLWQGALVTSIAMLLTVCVPERHAATRHAIWFTALLAIAIAPAATLWHPTQAITTLPSPVQNTATVTTIITAKAASKSGNWLLIVWVAGVFFCLARLAGSYLRIAQTVRAAKPAPDLGLGAEVMTSYDLKVPIAAGLFAPKVIIPAYLTVTLDRSELESIVAHERAHIRRSDILTNLAQHVVEACLFFNPWVYFIGWQLVKEREAACDAWAIHATGEPYRYASCLAKLAESAGRAGDPLLTPSAIGSRRIFVGRIARLTNGKAMQLRTNYAVVVASGFLFALLAVLLQTSSGSAPAVAAADASSLSNTKCWHDVKVVNAPAPNISKAAGNWKPNLDAGALVTIAPDGQLVSAKIVKSSGDASVDKATLDAARASTYAPAVADCKALQSTYYFHVSTPPN